VTASASALEVSVPALEAAGVPAEVAVELGVAARERLRQSPTIVVRQ
jgi:hypothetical protein